MKKFEGKSVVVTGAGLGIGYGLCRAFAAEGATVALNDIDLKLAQEGANRINQEVGSEQVYPYSGDVSDVESVRHMFADFVAKTGRLDIAIANAGITNYGEFLDYSPQAFDRVTGVNLRGTFFTAQTAAKIMIEKQIPGRILLMSSVTGVQGFLNLAAYGMTKAAIRMLARTITVEIGKYGITVNAICPGAILTERTLLDDPNYEENWSSVTPSRRAGYVEDIVAAALFLASPEARHVAGQTLIVDGGWSVQSPLPEGHPDKPEFSSQLR